MKEKRKNEKDKNNQPIPTLRFSMSLHPFSHPQSRLPSLALRDGLASSLSLICLLPSLTSLTISYSFVQKLIHYLVNPPPSAHIYNASLVANPRSYRRWLVYENWKKEKKEKRNRKESVRSLRPREEVSESPFIYNSSLRRAQELPEQTAFSIL